MSIKKETILQLSPLETKVLKLVCRENTNSEIAKKIGVSLRSTEKVKTRLYKKTRTRSGIGLFKWAINNGHYNLKEGLSKN